MAQHIVCRTIRARGAGAKLLRMPSVHDHSWNESTFENSDAVLRRRFGGCPIKHFAHLVRSEPTLASLETSGFQRSMGGRVGLQIAAVAPHKSKIGVGGLPHPVRNRATNARPQSLQRGQRHKSKKQFLQKENLNDVTRPERNKSPTGRGREQPPTEQLLLAPPSPRTPFEILRKRA